MATPLQQLGEHGQSVWLDFISRELLTSGSSSATSRATTSPG